MARLKNTSIGNSTGYLTIPSGTTAERYRVVPVLTGLYNNTPVVAVNGQALTISGNGAAWASYQNLPYYLANLTSTACINDLSSITYTITAPTRVYMVREPTWNSVDTTGWTLLETGKNYISGYSNLYVYQRDFDAGTYTVSNNSAMYLFKNNQDGQVRYNTTIGLTEYYVGGIWRDFTNGKAVNDGSVSFTTGLIGYWDAYYSYEGAWQSTSKDWNDMSGQGISLSMQGNLTWDRTQGFSNFTGNDHSNGNKWVAGAGNQGPTTYGFPTSLKTSQGGNGFTVICWAKSTGGTGSWRKLYGCADGDNYIDQYQSPSGYWATESGCTLYVNDSTSTSGSGHYMADSVWRQYASTNSNAGTLTNPTQSFTIGNEPGGPPPTSNSYPWVGNIALLRFYDRVLTQAEITQIYYHYRSRFGV